MQTHDGNDQRPEASNPDGRRNDERSAVLDEGQLVRPQVPDVADRTVCLSACLTGSGKVST